jgi:hypothetical protein
MERRKRILVAPLDWGLGHATRCIPVINALLKRQVEVMLAGSGGSLQLLRDEFPALTYFKLPAYAPEYPVNRSMVWKMGEQLPKFIRVISEEQKITERLVKEEGIDVVISDNRYGCYSKRAKSIFITHQINLLMPDEWKWMQPAVNWFNRRQLNKFNSVLIPAITTSAGGIFPSELIKGHGKLNAQLIGFLSRFEKKSCERKYDIAVVCSGPEPQRGIFEKMMLEQLKELSMDAIVIGGRMSEESTLSPASLNREKRLSSGGTSSFQQAAVKEANCSYVNFMDAQELNRTLEQSDLIIARPGYSTVMDLAKLGKKAIFIPTPGQTEQAYLAAELMDKGIAFSMSQNEFNIGIALKESGNYTGFKNFEYQDDLLWKALSSLV